MMWGSVDAVTAVAESLWVADFGARIGHGAVGKSVCDCALSDRDAERAGHLLYAAGQIDRRTERWTIRTPDDRGRCKAR